MSKVQEVKQNDLNAACTFFESPLLSTTDQRFLQVIKTRLDLRLTRSFIILDIKQ
jgi:hypothetical protein